MRRHLPHHIFSNGHVLKGWLVDWCKFVTGKGRKGNVNFDIGAQDAVDIINDFIKKFGGSVKVGLAPRVRCSVKDT
ncbi:uncharacterized protein N7443_009368 [Penicillium atrosanguineum]|uniref:uncharacterized protein n=1 Tax=Penicillium atrosanguineum TaxID=1132637 RepID=UPI00238545B0|nr:uncharacterized protein N7443_009368 [Penicillium atrosanguineum]KAJ5293415.1 hypothetical protein N7443_009368 [Penicillium atrosanguineum]